MKHMLMLCNKMHEFLRNIFPLYKVFDAYAFLLEIYVHRGMVSKYGTPVAIYTLS